MRKLFVDIKHDNIVIVDIIDGYKPREYTNRLHFNKDIPLTIISKDTIIVDTNTSKITIKSIIDNNTSMSIFNGKRDKKIQYTSGWSGLGHDKLFKTNTLVVSKKGKGVKFVTIISKNKFSIDRKNLKVVFEYYTISYK